MDGDAWMTLMPLEDLPDRKPVAASLEGVNVLVVRDGDRLFAIGDRCTHQGAPLHRGRAAFGASLSTVACPIHGSQFDLATGAVRRGPAMTPVPAYDVRVDEGMIQVRDRT